MSDDLDSAVFAAADPAAEPPPQHDPGAADELVTVCHSSVEWVNTWMVHYAFPPSSWCDRWEEHPSAAARIHALWQAWEVALVEGGAAMSSWWLIHFDGHMAALGAARGPFARCHTGHAASDPWRSP